MTSKDYIKALEKSVNAMKQNGNSEISIIGTTSFFESMIKSIKQDLDRLEKLEKDFEELKELNQFNYKSVKCEEHNYKLLENEYIKLEKENEELKERYKHRAETSNDLCKEVKQYEKAIEILKEKKVDIPKLLANDFNNYNALAVFFGFKQLTQEEYELLKEVLGNGR